MQKFKNLHFFQKLKLNRRTNFIIIFLQKYFLNKINLQKKSYIFKFQLNPIMCINDVYNLNSDSFLGLGDGGAVGIAIKSNSIETKIGLNTPNFSLLCARIRYLF